MAIVIERVGDDYEAKLNSVVPRFGLALVVTLAVSCATACSSSPCAPPAARSHVEQPGVPFAVTFEVRSHTCPEPSTESQPDCPQGEFVTPGSPLPELDFGGAYWQVADPPVALAQLNAAAPGTYTFEARATITDQDHASLDVAGTMLDATRMRHFGCS